MSRQAGPRDSERKAKRLAAVVGIAGLVVATLTLLFTIPGGILATRDLAGDPTRTPASPVSVPTSPSTPANSANISVSRTPTVGCFSQGRQVSCQAAHDVERVATETCAPGGLIRFLGGSPELDLLDGSLTTHQVGESCEIRGLRTTTAESLADILRRPTGDAYRPCWDTETNASVSCDQPHQAEKIYSGGPEPVDCRARFKDFAGVALDQHPSLEVEVKAGETTVCWVKLRSRNVLTASLRRLGDRALPLA